jgi:REP element-mobilizing transposase RayT
MSSHRQTLYHIVFGTKNRKPALPDECCEDLYKYIWGVIKKHNCRLYRINGVIDHLHILSDLHPTIALADYIKNIKVSSSIWMKESSKFPDFEGWQEGYGSFTYSIREKDVLIEYIKNQKVHHKTESFYDEFRKLLLENEVKFDERYVLCGFHSNLVH